MVMTPLFQRKREWAAFIDETPGVPIELMKGDSTDPGLKHSRKPHTKVNFMPHFATIEPIKFQLDQGRFELKKQVPVKSMFYLIEG
jgi:hypothetical protein